MTRKSQALAAARLERGAPSAADAQRAFPRTARYWEIDALRGLAVVMMVVYHILWDLWYLDVLPNIVLWEGFWKYFQRATASTFILLAGVSMALLTQRTRAADDDALVRRFVWRGLRILGYGMLLTAAIGLSGIGRLDFGILHLLGVSMLAAIPLRRLAWTNIFLWAVLFIAGFIVQSASSTTLWFVPLGLAPAQYTPLDYFPLVPWFGVVLLGMGVANLLYSASASARRYTLPDWSDVAAIKWLRTLGRHSLLIYLLHQPAIWLLLYLLGIARV